MPRQQLGLRNNRLDHMTLVKEEVVIAHYHSVIDRYMQGLQMTSKDRTVLGYFADIVALSTPGRSDLPVAAANPARKPKTIAGPMVPPAPP